MWQHLPDVYTDPLQMPPAVCTNTIHYIHLQPQTVYVKCRNWLLCNRQMAVWLITAPDRTWPHRAVHDHTGPCFTLILVYCRCLLTEIWRWPIPTWSREDSESVQEATCSWALDDFEDWLTLTMRLTDTWTQFIHDTVVDVYNCKYLAIVQHSFFCLTLTLA